MAEAKKPTDTSDLEAAYLDAMNSIETAWQNAVGAKDQQKPAPKPPSNKAPTNG